ncbi:hypothetical protein BBI11_13045 [Planococcus maritimus]|uniref:hypothetical protein n=1 Tax=Planococcus maritimus TaxID=192421 RepID=UPI00080EEF62|nr:hypothetical protein [Planococcus maritimus]ANU17900.1 hypothetical protein BBI11_13045 [Planococcus maritimus]
MGIFNGKRKNRAENYLMEGLQAHKDKDALKAISFLEKALAELPLDAKEQIFQVYLFSGVNYKRINDLETAYIMYKKASEFASSGENLTEVHNALGKICYLLNKQDESVENYMISIGSAINWTTEEHFKVLGGNLYHHLGHALADFHTNLPNEFKLLIPEYKKSLMGSSNLYNQDAIPTYIDLAIGYWKENKAMYM